MPMKRMKQRFFVSLRRLMEQNQLMRYVILLLLLGGILTSSAQQAQINGIVRDAQSREPLMGVNIQESGTTNGVSSSADGNFSLKTATGEVSLIVSFLGYRTDTLTYELRDGQSKNISISLKNTDQELNTVVVSTSKYGKKIQKETVSMDVIKPRFIETNNLTSLQQAVDRLPGVAVLDGQISIRGGSGYAYGAGSRVIQVIDDLPLLTPDRGEIKWEFTPLENASQIELIKGSSTVQYGSAALNGVLHVRTAWPGEKPETRFSAYTELVGSPPSKEYQWWVRNGRNFFKSPSTLGYTFLHKQKFGQLDLVIGGNMHTSQSHLIDEIDRRIRTNIKLRYIPKKLNRLSFGLNANAMYRKSSFMFYWKDAEHPYESAPGVVLNERFAYFYIDPWFNFIDKKNSQHRILSRIFFQQNINGAPNNGPHTRIYTLDYQFRHDFGSIFKIIAGATNNHFTMVDGTLGNRDGDFGGVYVQGDLNWKNLSVNGGGRMEFVRVQERLLASKPVFRLGVNYQIKKYNYLRASFGQAFRVPSIAERFVEYQLAGIRIIPNLDIRPEQGYSLELGYKRSLSFGNFKGYLDFVTFWTEFQDMVEFTFDVASDAGGIYPFFQSRNVNKARVFGWEIEAVGEGKIGPVDLTVLAGYTYIYPVDLRDTATFFSVGSYLKRAFTTFYNPSEDEKTGMLKYRNRHLFKADIDALLFKKYRIGTSIRYYSFMDKVDPVFELLIQGLAQQRIDRYNRGDLILDMRAGVNLTPQMAVNFIVRNSLNSDYALRPAKPNQPRTFVVQYQLNF